MNNEPIKESDVKLENAGHWSLAKWYWTLYRDEKLGIQKEVGVHRDMNGYQTNKSCEEWYIDGDKRKYKSLTELLIVYNDKQNNL